MLTRGVAVWSKTAHDACRARHADDRTGTLRGHYSSGVFAAIEDTV